MDAPRSRLAALGSRDIRLLRRILSGRSDANIRFNKSKQFGSEMTGKYEISIRWSDEDDAFIAEVPELPGCNAHGPTYADAAREVEVAMSLWLDMAAEFGWEIPEPKERGTDGATAETSRKYEINMYWSEEDEAILAEVPELPGCVADGRTYEEALAEAQVVMDLWIETAKEFGREIPKPKTRPHFV